MDGTGGGLVSIEAAQTLWDPAPILRGLSHPRSELFITSRAPIQGDLLLMMAPSPAPHPWGRLWHASRMKDYPSCWVLGILQNTPELRE